MLPVAITFYDIVLFVHILAVVLAFGVTFTYGLVFSYARKANPGDLAALHRMQVLLTKRLITPMMVVILVAGLYLAIDRWELLDPWIAATFAILIVLFGLMGAVFTPSEKRLVAIAERDGGTPSDEYDRESERLGKFGALAGLLVVAAIFLMTVKPGA